MRYAEYLKQTTKLEKQIADCLGREIKAASGNGPWYVRLFPSLRSTTIEVANRKRGVLARKRAQLEREMFADPSTVWNADVTAVFRATVPSSPDAVERLREAANAMIDVQQ
jgi:hypothetical protein